MYQIHHASPEQTVFQLLPVFIRIDQGLSVFARIVYQVKHCVGAIISILRGVVSVFELYITSQDTWVHSSSINRTVHVIAAVVLVGGVTSIQLPDHDALHAVQFIFHVFLIVLFQQLPSITHMLIIRFSYNNLVHVTSLVYRKLELVKLGGVSFIVNIAYFVVSFHKLSRTVRYCIFDVFHV